MYLLALLAAAAALSPQAHSDPTPPSLHVRYADLDLSHRGDRKIFERRIARAIDTLCAATNPGKLTANPAALECRRNAERSVEPQRQQALARAGAPVLVSAAR